MAALALFASAVAAAMLLQALAGILHADGGAIVGGILGALMFGVLATWWWSQARRESARSITSLARLIAAFVVLQGFLLGAGFYVNSGSLVLAVTVGAGWVALLWAVWKMSRLVVRTLKARPDGAQRPN